MHASDIHFPAPIGHYIRSKSSRYNELTFKLMLSDNVEASIVEPPRAGLVAIPPKDHESPVTTLDQYHQISAYQAHDVVDHILYTISAPPSAPG